MIWQMVTERSASIGGGIAPAALVVLRAVDQVDGGLEGAPQAGIGGHAVGFGEVQGGEAMRIHVARIAAEVAGELVLRAEDVFQRMRALLAVLPAGRGMPAGQEGHAAQAGDAGAIVEAAVRLLKLQQRGQAALDRRIGGDDFGCQALLGQQQREDQRQGVRGPAQPGQRQRA